MFQEKLAVGKQSPLGPVVPVLLDCLDRRLMLYLALSKVTEQLVAARREELICGTQVPDVVELADFVNLATEVERGRRGARIDEERVWEIKNALRLIGGDE